MNNKIAFALFMILLLAGAYASSPLIGAANVAGNAIRSQVNSLGEIGVYGDKSATWFLNGDKLDSEILSRTSDALPKEQICVSPGRYSGQIDVISEGKIILAKEDSKVAIKVLCERQNEIAATLSDYGDDDLSAQNLSSCGFNQNSANVGCIVVISNLEKATPPQPQNDLIFVVFAIAVLLVFAVLAAILVLGPLAGLFLAKDNTAKIILGLKTVLWAIAIAMKATITNTSAGDIIFAMPFIQIALTIFVNSKIDKSTENKKIVSLIKAVMVIEIALVLGVILNYFISQSIMLR